MCCKENILYNMDRIKRKSARCDMYYNEISARLTSPSTAEKIQDIRHQLEEVLASAYNKRTKRTPRNTRLSPVLNQFNNPSLSIKESRKEIKNPFYNECVIPTDAKLLAYKKFITSLTRIIQDTNQYTPDSYSMSTSLNVKNVRLGTQKKFIAEKGTFLVQKGILTEPNHAVKDGGTYESQCAEKTTYCRPVACSQEFLCKTMEKNAKLQQLVKKLVQAREKEKQNEAWNNYINELKNKHGYYDFRSDKKIKLYDQEDDKTRNIIIDDSYDVRHSWKQSNLCTHMFDDIYEAAKAANTTRKESSIRNRTWCVPSTSKPHKYANNTFCCPMSSQGRLLMIKKANRGPCYTLRNPRRYFRGSSIVVDKEPVKKLSLSSSRNDINSNNTTNVLFECRAIQTNESYVSKTMLGDKPDTDTKTKDEKKPSFVEKIKSKMKLPRQNSKQTLFKIEHKLDILIESFNGFLEELKSKKLLANVKSESVSRSSVSNLNSTYKTKSDTYNVLTKHNIICEVPQQKLHSSVSFPPCPISQRNINEILGEEKDKSDKVKKDIDKILNTQCAVQISIDIPTKEGSTEVTSSFYKKKEEDAVVEEMEPGESEEMEKMKRMTIAVNTDPMGILALFRVSAETVKQILSYVPNLDYVTYLARRQLGNSNALARYVCNICSATFTRPSALSDHIKEHNIGNSKHCCVCRHVLDRLSHRSGLFACSHCGQMFTRAYCRELHEQTCTMAGSKHRVRPSFILLT